MRQERKRYSERDGKFEDGVLRTDACFDRHCAPRDEELRTPQEDAAVYAAGTSALWEERRLVAAAYELMALGIRPSPDESLEDFVASHIEEVTE